MKAWEVLDAEGKWCKNAVALDKGTYVVNPCLPEACRFCLQGAYMRAYGVRDPVRLDADAGWKRLVRALREKGFHYPYEFNDDPATEYEDVIGLLKELDV